MHVGRYIKFKQVFRWTFNDTVIFLIIASIPTLCYELLGMHWITIPWLPVALIGTAVAFIIGFKNSASYDRLWEARKIWGAIVNLSRSWGIMVRDFIKNSESSGSISLSDIKIIYTRLIYRHIGWLTALRFQLRQPRKWEHINDKSEQQFRNMYSIPELENSLEDILPQYLSKDDMEYIAHKANKATHIISLQSKELKNLHDTGLIDDFRYLVMQNKLSDFYDQQGQCERIKTFPYPRQYATLHIIFVWIFILLVPFGMIEEFENMGDYFVWVTIPFSILVSWVMHTMIRIGDASENPFEGGVNDIPMAAISRTIEIDLKDMLDEEEIPAPVKPINDILM